MKLFNINPVRALSTVGATVVGGIAAWASWSHMVHVAQRAGERPEVAYVMPLSVDGLLVVASAAMVRDRQDGRTPRMSAKVAFAIGICASLAANVANAQPTVLARIVAGWPALSLLLTVEVLARRGKRPGERRSWFRRGPIFAPVGDGAYAATQADSSQADGDGDAAKSRRQKPAPKTRRAAITAASRPELTASEVAKLAGVSPRTARRAVSQPREFSTSKLGAR